MRISENLNLNFLWKPETFSKIKSTAYPKEHKSMAEMSKQKHLSLFIVLGLKVFNKPAPRPVQFIGGNICPSVGCLFVPP